MAFIKKYKKILIVVVIVIVAFALYSVFFSGRVDTSLLVAQNSSNAAVVGGEFLTLLLELKAISLDTSVFDDPAFRSLRDYSKELIPEPVGRPNPFAPIGDVSVEGESEFFGEIFSNDSFASETEASTTQSTTTEFETDDSSFTDTELDNVFNEDDFFDELGI